MADSCASPTATDAPSSSFTAEAGEGGEEQLVRITALAAEKVQEIRQAEGIEEDMALRLRVVGGGCSGFSYDLYFDPKNEMDRELTSNGVRIVVDQMSLMYLVGTEIDYVE